MGSLSKHCIELRNRRGCECICNLLNGLKPVLGMLLVSVLGAVLNIFYKLVAIDGMNLRVFVAYRVILATVFLVPLAHVVERNKRPKLTWIILLQAFLCGLFGVILALNLYLESIVLVSATFAAAMNNLLPAITFIMAVCLRMEKLVIRSVPGAAKVVGSLVGIGGAMIFTLYKGTIIQIWSTHPHLFHMNKNTSSSQANHSANPALGSVLAVVSCLCAATWYIIQGKMSKTYPCVLSCTALVSVMATIQSVILALCMERDWSKWKLGWNIRLLGVVYSGIVSSGLAMCLTLWCMNMRGPLFVSSFNPVTLIVVAIFGSLLLQEKLYLGSILGASLIICGLYVLLWGKSKEMKKPMRVEPVLETPRPSETQAIEIVTSTSPIEPSVNTSTENDNNNNTNDSLIAVGHLDTMNLEIEIDFRLRS
ncbi:putative EamA domain-containing protein [Rosa chinensis]|uniref:Putative EamA domain-containing protein n=1 Tax=Rosa chinensis TaxID=74649 RepID=A0A2P6PDV3_ROSCH|nr:WAT1-related protein At1g68170 [Rosa chinensis]PRQ20108.1 putative EamA domain-containing protein [Rosa chinensis]